MASWSASAHRSPGVLELAIGPRAGTRLDADGSRLDATTVVVHFRDDDRLTRLDHEVDTARRGALQTRLRSTLGDLAEANQSLSDRNLDLDQYATAVAHDLRTPLYVVRAYATRSRGRRAPIAARSPLPSAGPLRILGGPVPPPADGR